MTKNKNYLLFMDETITYVTKKLICMFYIVYPEVLNTMKIPKVNSLKLVT